MKALGAMMGLALALLGSPNLAHAQDAAASEAPVPKQVELVILKVKASTDGKFVDPKLEHVARLLGHLNFTNFEYLGEHTWKVSDGQTKSLTVADLKLDVTMVSHDEKFARVQVVVFRDGKKVTEHSQSVPRQKIAMIGARSEDAGAIFLPIRAIY